MLFVDSRIDGDEESIAGSDILIIFAEHISQTD
jgi:hypothetical protein